MRLKASDDWQGRWRNLRAKVERVESEAQLEARLATLSDPERVRILAFVNAHAMNCAAASPEFFDALTSADTLFRDGAGMEQLYRACGQSPGLNLNGTDLIPQLVKRFDGRKIALLGTRNPFLVGAAEQIKATLAGRSVIVAMDGFQSERAYVEFIRSEAPDLIVLGMGMPKQELVASLIRREVERPCLIVCGGAIIDFLGGKVRRAPAWVRKAGLEWVFRLLLEPRRLFRRYVVGNPLFLSRVWRLVAAER